MAVYRKKLVDKDGNTIIPAVGDIYGTVYNATLSSATAGGRADYEFNPDTPIENNKVYAVKFPDPTVNNATIILGDGVVSGSILVPPVAATDSPNYELLTTDMINNTEPLLLMYNGVQWVCLNQKKKVATADLNDGAVASNKIDWATFGNDSSYIQLGKVLICWGSIIFPNPNTGDYGETNSGNITFPKTYASTPKVVCQMHDQAGGVGEYCAVGEISTTAFNVWGGHTRATSSRSNVIYWIAIGITN